MQSKQQGYLFLLVVIGLAVLSGFFFSRTKEQYGLDVKGGVRLTMRVKYDKDKEEEQRKNLPQIRQNLVKVLTSRVSAALGVVEGTVMPKGEDEFIVEIPGFTDVETARRTLNSTAKLIAYHATNVKTPTKDFRRYSPAGREDLKGVPVESFFDSVLNKKISFQDPQYSQMISEWTKVLEGDDLSKAAWTRDAGGTKPQFYFSPNGAKKMEEWSRVAGKTEEYLAFVLDGQVLSIAPLKKDVILKEEAYIDGNFDASYVIGLANLLNAGSLPVSLEETSSTQVSPTIGNYALNQMVNAGLISLAVIVLFLLVYYAFPGFVAFVALGLYVLFTLTVMKLIGATFSLAAIAGFILSVGMAVDANILVFERLKEEMRNGRSLMTAVELGFKRAFPAILDSNVCTILTSAVLFFLGTGPVKGFASTLILGVAMSLFTAVVVTRSLLVFLVGSGIGRDPKYYAMDRSWFGEHLEEKANQEPLKVMQRSNLWFMISVLTIIPGAIAFFMGGIKPNVEFRGGIEAEYVQLGTVKSQAEVASALEKAGFEGPIVKQSIAPNQTLATFKFGVPAGTNATDPLVKSNILKATQLSASAIQYKVDGSNVELIMMKPPSSTVAEAELERRMTDAGYTGVDVTMKSETLNLISMTIDPKKGTDPNSPEVRDEVTKVVGLGTEPVSFSSVGPSIQQETISNAYLGVIISAVLIVVWLTLRFGFAIGSWRKGLMFGLSAIGALVHDVLVVVGIAAIFGYLLNWQVSTLFLTAMLTVIGFSVHDTIVIFDRIRENLHRPLSGETFEHLCNRSVTQSFGRSINTSMTVIATLLILIFMGTPTVDLKFFCVTMLAGIVSGTYSSIFNATPILWVWDRWIGKTRGEDHTLIADAIKEEQRRRAAAQAVLAQEGATSYGTVKRRRSVKDQARQDLD